MADEKADKDDASDDKSGAGEPKTKKPAAGRQGSGRGHRATISAKKQHSATRSNRSLASMQRELARSEAVAEVREHQQELAEEENADSKSDDAG